MQIIKHRKIINDPWRHSDHADEFVILPLARWQELRATIAAKNIANIGVKLSPEDSVDEIAADLKKLSVIALNFPTFNEGRGYTQATQLRQHHNYGGEIRAVGVYRDNLALLEQCGFGEFEMAGGEDIADALAGFTEIAVGDSSVSTV